MPLQPDTLVCDSSLLVRWQTSSDYDYGRELSVPDMNVFQWLGQQWDEFLESLLGNRIAGEYGDPILFGLGLLALAFGVWFVYRHHPGLFIRNRKNRTAELVPEADTIYGVDFEGGIASSLKRNDYREAVRLLYLQTLRRLSDDGEVFWQDSKTPTDYIYEVKDERRRQDFARLTRCFLRVRYGHYEASCALFDEMKALQAAMEKGGGHEAGA